MNAVLIEVKNAVCVVTLNRPDRLNALNADIHAGLREAFDKIENDDAIRAVLLTGAGRGFCAGADLMQSLAGGTRDLGESIDKDYNPLVRRMRACPKPIICAVNGVAAGAGMNLALAGDIIIAAKSANFTQAFIRIGLIPDAGGTYFLPRLIGDARARAMAMLGETISAEQAEAFGLVYKLFEDANFADEALALATALAAKPAKALAAMKQAFNQSASNTLDAQLDVERDLQRKMGSTPDFAEGVKAFIEKRPAVFTGKA
ncbi:MAG: 2-(1,2-epoxy-1,2-dihydrophenyl)acetyl-CoA isomerase [Acidocella sp. 20-57-95]|nr:MAG: 2-(1,2-epoxy-1,2-dihydrophenyl)acetyl-CoA isomerase [Acidocella sp. 20-57-95]HQT63544.1 2-(1,2-epoxy-1,2-dihydrophenyl)acetyl-CoA isomerase PaaG [Acidocella sp.]